MIGPKLSEIEKGEIEKQIATYVSNNWMILMDSEANFDEISKTMCDDLIYTSCKIADMIFGRTDCKFVRPPPI